MSKHEQVNLFPGGRVRTHLKGLETTGFFFFFTKAPIFLQTYFDQHSYTDSELP